MAVILRCEHRRQVYAVRASLTARSLRDLAPLGDGRRESFSAVAVMSAFVGDDDRIYCAGSTRLSEGIVGIVGTVEIVGSCTGASATAAGRGKVSATLASTLRQ